MEQEQPKQSEVAYEWNPLPRIVHSTANLLVVARDPKPGTENKVGYSYAVVNPSRMATEESSIIAEVRFQNGKFDDKGANGVTAEALLDILIDRTTEVNRRFPCQENLDAIDYMRKALASFHERVAKRTERGVQNTHIV